MYSEAGASGTTDRRPELQRLIRDASARPAPFVAVLVYNLSRFFRNAEESSAYKIKLAKRGIKLISVTQDFGEGPHAQLITQIMSSVDQYSSDINAEQVRLVMKANAAAGWWNGSRPPYGYKVEAATQVGKKTKKQLTIDEDEAGVVKYVFQLYLFGEEGTGPFGIKQITTHLNAKQIKLRGKRFITSTVADMLRRQTYVGEHFYNVRDSRTKQVRPREEWISIPVPPIVLQDEFDAAQARVNRNKPANTPPRRVNSPTLLASVGKCGEPCCNSGLVLMTGKGGRYRYLTCQNKRIQAADACSLRNFPVDAVDNAVIDALAERLLHPDRLAQLLAGLIEKSDTAFAERKARLSRLKARRTELEGATSRLWDAIEQGLADPKDPDIGARIEARRAEIRSINEEIRLIEAHDHDRQKRKITQDVLSRFGTLMSDALRWPDDALRKSYLHMLVSEVRLSNQGLTIRGRTNQLEMVVARSADAEQRLVPTFAKDWRTRQDSNL